MAEAIENKVSDLRQKMAAIKEDINNVLNSATAEDRDLEPDEAIAAKALQSDYDDKERELEVYTRQLEIERHSAEVHARITDPDDMIEAEPEVQPVEPVKMRNREIERTKWSVSTRSRRINEEKIMASTNFGFSTFGDWAKSVYRASVGNEMDDRLKVVRAQQQSSVGADGGFLIPPGFTNQIVEVVLNDEVNSLAARCWQIPIMGNNTRIPLNMDTPYGNGIRAYWGAEASTHTRSTANLEQASMNMHKVTALVPVTEELLEDAPAIGALISSKAPQAIAWEIGDAIVNGNGQNRPTGIMNSSTAALVTVAKETNQAAGSIVKENVYKMMSHLPMSCQMMSVWLASPTAQAQLWDVLLENRGDPGKGLEVSPYESILSRPIIQHLALQNVGTAGDLLLADLSQYAFIYKSQGVRSAMSMHMAFDQDIMMMKFQMRCNGIPTWTKQIDVAKGSHKLSPFVRLATRS